VREKKKNSNNESDRPFCAMLRARRKQRRRCCSFPRARRKKVNTNTNNSNNPKREERERKRVNEKKKKNLPRATRAQTRKKSRRAHRTFGPRLLLIVLATLFAADMFAFCASIPLSRCLELCSCFVASEKERERELKNQRRDPERT
jgi:hypothetical protein